MLRAGASLPEVGQVLRHRQPAQHRDLRQGRPRRAAGRSPAPWPEVRHELRCAGSAAGLSGDSPRARVQARARREAAWPVHRLPGRASAPTRSRPSAALRWATLPPATRARRWHASGSASCAASRATCTRSTRAHELPPPDLLPAAAAARRCPTSTTDDEIRALMDAGRTLATPHRAATMRTLIGLLAVTGMRIGEAIRLDRGDIDLEHGRADRRATASSASPASCRCTRRRSRRCAATSRAATGPSRRADAGAAVHLSGRDGSTYCNVHWRSSGSLRARRAHARARRSADPGRMTCATRSPSTRCWTPTAPASDPAGPHRAAVAPTSGTSTRIDSYWYLQAAPELLALAADRLERHSRRRAR